MPSLRRAFRNDPIGSIDCSKNRRSLGIAVARPRNSLFFKSAPCLEIFTSITGHESEALVEL